MAIAVLCPECGHSFSVRDEYAGKRGKCPSCGGIFRAEVPEEPEDDLALVMTNGSSRLGGARAGGASSRYGTAAVSKGRGSQVPAYRKNSGMPAWGWAAILFMILLTGGAVAGAMTLAPNAEELKKEAQEQAAAAEKARKQLVKAVNKEITAVEDEISPLDKRVEEAVREKTIEDDVMPAIVKVLNFRNGQPAGSGTGWFFKVDDKMLVATNQHVVNRCTSLVIELQDGSKWDIEGFIAASADWDLAILKTKTDVPKARALKIAENSGTVKSGDTVYACGNPGAHRHTITRGIVSRNVSMRQVTAEGAQTDYPWTVNPNQDIMWIEHDARIWPGNSGGPLLNEDLEVIGVNTRGLMVLMQRPTRLRFRGVRMVPTFGLASNSMYILEMIEKNKSGPVKPLSELPVMEMN